MTRIRRYSELLAFDSFEDRFEYLKLEGAVGRETFGFDRYINQAFYSSYEWRRVRELVVIRDNGCDLGIFGYEIRTVPLVHHINPLTIEDLIGHEDWVLNPEFLITTSFRTHNAIHYGAKNLQPKVVTVRSPGDTRLW